MAIQRTFSIIKPDATRRNLTGAINAKLEAAGLRIIAQKRLHLTRAQAEAFYAVHKERPFFAELTEFISSAPIVAQVLEGEDAIMKNREVMGATNPAEAAEGTIRKEFALSIGENSVHGSDGPDTAAVEIAYFFSGPRARRLIAARRTGRARLERRARPAGVAHLRLQRLEAGAQGRLLVAVAFAPWRSSIASTSAQ